MALKRNSFTGRIRSYVYIYIFFFKFISILIYMIFRTDYYFRIITMNNMVFDEEFHGNMLTKLGQLGCSSFKHPSPD